MSNNNEEKIVMPDSSKVNMMSETEAVLYAQELVTVYKKLEKNLYREYQKLVSKKESFPRKYIEKEDYEDLMIQAAGAKFDAIVVARRLTGLSAEIKVELDFLNANFKLYVADDALSDKFEKITEGLRDAYVNSKQEIKELSKLYDRISNYADSAEKLIRAFDSDEINFRRIADKKNKIAGFS